MSNAMKRVDANRGAADSLSELELHAQKLAQMEKMAAIGQLSSSVAHEMRNLLGVIRNAAFNIDRALVDEDPALRSNLDMINRSVSRARQFIENLLNLSRVPCGQKEMIDVGAAVDDLLGLFAKEMEWRRIELRRCYEPMSPFHLDRNRLHECILNLVINALQSMEQGGVLTVVIAPWRDGLSIEISDTGCGIPREVLPDIFRRFFTTKQNSEGTGLGLTISQQLAVELGGSIEVESEVGRGSAFVIKLPSLASTGVAHAGRAPSLVKVK